MDKGRFKPEVMIGPAVVTVLILITIGVLIIYRQPMGPPLEVSTRGDVSATGLSVFESISQEPTSAAASAGTSEPEAISAIVPTEGPETASESEATDVPEPTSPPTTAPVNPDAAASTSSVRVCGENEVWNILVVGSDASDLWYPQGSDLTRVLRVDFPNRTISLFALSRDLWVDATSVGMQDPEITFTKLGMVFYEARKRSEGTDIQDTMQDGLNAIAQTLSVNFDLSFDHYLGIDLDKFPAMVDTVGGVPISIPTALTDPKSGMSFRAGQQTLNGEQAAIYARAFLTTDLSRIDRNEIMLEALRQKVLDPLVWIKVPRLYIQFRDAINSDLSLEEINHLVCLLKEVEGETIIQDEVLEEWVSPGPEGSLLWDKEKVFGRLEELGMIP
jgi:LCP family protein required for cell wall assembly